MTGYRKEQFDALSRIVNAEKRRRQIDPLTKEAMQEMGSRAHSEHLRSRMHAAGRIIDDAMGPSRQMADIERAISVLRRALIAMAILAALFVSLVAISAFGPTIVGWVK